jgi:hypothetical protein
MIIAYRIGRRVGSNDEPDAPARESGSKLKEAKLK